jgi:hypothetical protein
VQEALIDTERRVVPGTQRPKLVVGRFGIRLFEEDAAAIDVYRNLS